MPSSGKTLGAIEMVAGAIMMYEGAAGSSLYEMGASMFFSGAFTELSLMLQPSPATAGQDGIIRSSVANQQIVYGQIKTGGVLTFANTYGSNGSNTNAFLTCTIAHSLTRQNSAGTGGMPIQGIQGFYINDVYVPLHTGNSYGGWNAGRGSASGTGACSITAGSNGGTQMPWNPLAGNLWMSFSDGSQTTPDPILPANFPALPANFIGFGIAYSTWVMFMSADQPTFTAAFPSGLNTPSTLGVVLAGQLLYDPRLDSNNGGSGTQRLNDTTTWVYSSNPALVLADYLTRSKNDGGGGYAAGTYSGGSVINSQVNWAAVAAAANICDENVTVPQYGATWNGSAWSATDTVARYSCNMAVPTQRNCDANVADILKTMAGFVTVVGGQIYMFAGAETTSSGTLDETFLAGPAGFSPQIQRSQMYNAVKMTYGQEPQQDYNQAQGVAIVNNSYETEDGGVRLWFSDTIAGCNNQFQCQILERLKSQQSRNKQILNLVCNLKALNFQAGDVVDISISELNLSNAPFRIMQYSMGANYTVKMMLLQENAGSFVLPATPDGIYQPYNTPNYQTLYSLTPSAPSAPSGLTASPVATGILLEWTPPAPNQYDYQTVYRATASGGPYTAIAHVVGDNFVDTTGTVGTTYWYYLTATNFWNLTSPQSNTASAVMPNAISISGGNAVLNVNPTGGVTNTLPQPNHDPTVLWGSVTGLQSNYIPDSELRYGYIYIPNGSGTLWSVSPVPAEGVNGMLAVGTGSAWAVFYRYSIPFYLAPGTYTLSANCNGSANITSSYISASIYGFTKGTGLGSQLAAVNFGVGKNADGRFSTTFTVATGGYFVYLVNTNTATATSGKNVYIYKPQLEVGSVMTAYRSQFDAAGYSVLSGSGPQNVADLYFNWTSTTTTITLTPSNNEWYQADGTLVAFNNGTFFPGPNTESGFSASTSGKVYPYVDLQNNLLEYMNGGVGSPDNIVQTTAAEQLAAVAQQNNANRTPLSSGGVAVSTPASGSGGGSGGGNKCVHPSYLGVAIGAWLLTPDGQQMVAEAHRYPQSEWIKIFLTNGETAIVTPTHCFVTPSGELVKAKALKLKTILKADGGLVAVEKLECFADDSECIALAVPCGYFYVQPGGVLHKNGTIKP